MQAKRGSADYGASKSLMVGGGMMLGTLCIARGCRRGRRHVYRSAGKDAKADGQVYVNITGFPFPLGPILARRTVRKQIGEGIWTFEQEQSLANIAVNVRMTAIRLECGGLWIHNPIAPTDECVYLVSELGLPVRYIVLGSVQYEHKVFVGPFSRRWPDAKVYLTPQQWSWPIDLPSALYGIFAAGELKDGDAEIPWAAEIDQRLLSPSTRLGFSYSASECAFFHKKSKSLICTDALVFVPEAPPPVLDPDTLKGLGRDRNIVLDLVGFVNWRGSGPAVREAQEQEATRGAPGDDVLLAKGWQRNALLSLFFGPDGQTILDPTESFQSLAGRWIIGPVCYSLVYGGKIRKDVLEWSLKLCEWDFEQIIPCHFAGPVQGRPEDVRRAFQVLEDGVEATAKPEFALPWPFPQPVRYREKDLKLLSDIRNVLQSLDVI